MTAFFAKAIGELTADDVVGLLGNPEGQLLEFKGELPAESERGRAADPWLAAPEPGKSRRGPLEFAKRKLFREIVAFANAEGGWLVLGVTETDEKPARAEAVRPLPDCGELAERLMRAASDWIDPPITGLQVRGISSGEAGEGSVVFRVPRSPNAPHRLKPDSGGPAYKRVGEESKPMTMREVHDMVLQRATERSRLDEEFAFLRSRYGELVPKRSTEGAYVGVHIIAAPVGGPFAIERVYRSRDLFKRGSGPVAQGELHIPFFEGEDLRGASSGIQPVVRGGRAERSFVYVFGSTQHQVEDLRSVEVFDSGSVDTTLKVSGSGYNRVMVDWILAEVADVLRIVRDVRTLAGNPDAEYALEIELRKDTIQGAEHVPLRDQYHFGMFGEEESPSRIWQGPLTRLPRYSVGADDDLPQVLDLVLRDLHALQRREVPPNVGFVSIG